MDRSGIAYWNALSRYWAAAPPLSPSPDDVAWFGERVAGHDAPGGSDPLLLGVTQALTTLPWRPDTSLIALDWSGGMLQAAWNPPAGTSGFQRVRGDWRQMPLRSGSRGVLLGDGCYSALSDREDARLFTAEMHRVLRPAGEVWMRCFVQPEMPSSVAAVLDELGQGTARPANLYRWRLAMAVHGVNRFGFPLSEVWEAWASVPDRIEAARRLGWTDADLQRLERWRGERAHYAFPTFAELERIVTPWFEVSRVTRARHPFAECFPRLALRART